MDVSLKEEIKFGIIWLFIHIYFDIKVANESRAALEVEKVKLLYLILIVRKIQREHACAKSYNKSTE